jgi:hypothetical protein
VTSLSRSSRTLRKVDSSVTIGMLSVCVQMVHENIWGTVSHETGVKQSLPENKVGQSLMLVIRIQYKIVI